MSRVVLSGWDDEEPNLGLTLILCHAEDFRLAYLINKQCGAKLKNVSQERSIKKFDSEMQITMYYSPLQNSSAPFYLVLNQMLYKYNYQKSNNLFGQNLPLSTPLLKSFKKWPYFILTASPIDASFINSLSQIQSIISIQPFEFQSLTKSEQLIINNIFYEN